MHSVFRNGGGRDHQFAGHLEDASFLRSRQRYSCRRLRSSLIFQLDDSAATGDSLHSAFATAQYSSKYSGRVNLFDDNPTPPAMPSITSAQTRLGGFDSDARALRSRSQRQPQPRGISSVCRRSVKQRRPSGLGHHGHRHPTTSSLCSCWLPMGPFPLTQRTAPKTTAARWVSSRLTSRPEAAKPTRACPVGPLRREPSGS